MTYDVDEAEAALRDGISWPIEVDIRGGGEAATLDHGQVTIDGDGPRTEVYVTSQRRELLRAFKTNFESALEEFSDDTTQPQLTRIGGPNKFLLSSIPNESNSDPDTPSRPHQY